MSSVAAHSESCLPEGQPPSAQRCCTVCKNNYPNTEFVSVRKRIRTPTRQCARCRRLRRDSRARKEEPKTNERPSMTVLNLTETMTPSSAAPSQRPLGLGKTQNHTGMPLECPDSCRFSQGTRDIVGTNADRDSDTLAIENKKDGFLDDDRKVRRGQDSRHRQDMTRCDGE